MPDDVSRCFDIGGPDVLTYWGMMRRYAVIAGLPRRMVVPVPLLTPWLSAQWVNLVTPVPRSIAVPLISSLVHEVVCRDHDIADYVPDPARGLTGYDQAVALALARTRGVDVASRWPRATTTRARSRAPSDPLPTDPGWSGGTVYQDVRAVTTAVDAGGCGRSSGRGRRTWPPARPPNGPAGRPGRLARGVGRWRRTAGRQGAPGGSLGWWRIDDVEGPRRLRLRAQVRIPGRAWLELSAAPAAEGCVYQQRAVFEPHGLLGQLCWKLLAPLRGLRPEADGAHRHDGGRAASFPWASRGDHPGGLHPGPAGARQPTLATAVRRALQAVPVFVGTRDRPSGRPGAVPGRILEALGRSLRDRADDW